MSALPPWPPRLNVAADAPFDPRPALCRRDDARGRRAEGRGAAAHGPGPARVGAAGEGPPLPSAERPDRPAQARRDRDGAGRIDRHTHRPDRPAPGPGPRPEVGTLPRLRAGRDRRDRPDLLPRPVPLAREAVARRRDDDRLRPGRVVQRPPLDGPSRLRRAPRRGRDDEPGRAGLSDDRRALAEGAAQGDRPCGGAASRAVRMDRPIRRRAPALSGAGRDAALAARAGGRGRHRGRKSRRLAPRL